MSKQDVTIGFIGAGNMARSLIGGLINSGYEAGKIWAADSNSEKLEQLSQQYKINTTLDNHKLAASVDVLLFAVKPAAMKAAVTELAKEVHAKKPVVISIAAGVRLEKLQHWLGDDLAIVRCMPNTPAMVGCGATGLFANANVTTEQKSLAEAIMRAVGLAVWLSDEAQMDVVTGLSGSGPAYFFLVMEALEQAACELGLTPTMARLLTLQTASGAARMALETEGSVAQLRAHVTSPGGTTEHALKVLEQGSIRELFADALRAAQKRSIEMSE